MLECFGIRDVFSVIKKNRYLVGAWIIGLSLLFGFITYKNLQDLRASSNNKELLNVVSASYYVKPNVRNNASLEKIGSNLFKSLPDDFVAVLDTDAYTGYLSEKLLETYSGEYIVQKSNLEPKKNESKYLTQAVKSLYSAKRSKDSMVLNLYALSSDLELSETILNITKEYLEEHAEKQSGLVSLDFLGQTTKKVSSVQDLENSDEVSASTNVSSSGKKVSKKDIIKAVIKSMIIPVGGLTLLLVFVLSLRAFFYPTLNRKSDFCEYEIPVIGEVEI